MFVWEAKLETGIAMIDGQHMELVRIINELYEAETNNADDATARAVVCRLTAYVLFHFTEEEMLAGQIAAGTPHLAGHLEEHRRFREKVADLTAPERAITGERLKDILSFLHHWLFNHIMVTDQSLAALHRARPAKPRGSRP